MLAETIWMTAIIGGPVLLVCALIYAFIKNRGMTAEDRNELREAVDDRYEDADDGDVPVRVDMERRARNDIRKSRLISRPRSGYSARTWSHG